MRYLTVVRHGESSPATPGQSDFERPLSERGRSQCAELRAWAADLGALGAYGPVTALVSAAARTRETFQRAFEGLDFVAAVHTSELIYNGRREVTGEDLLIDLAALDPVTTSLLVVGHNPTVLELVRGLAARLPGKLRRGHFPTGAAYVLALPDDQPVGLRPYELVARFVPDTAGRS
ncbi:MAG: SixA phosphatase family protein [Acidimicrobiales bacterium]